MAKFRVTVTVVKEETYTVEIDANDEHKAEDMACGMWREKTGENFQVDKPSNWTIDETEQLTFNCEECGQEFAIDQRDKDYYDHCRPCAMKVEAAEQEQDQQRKMQQRSAMEE